MAKAKDGPIPWDEPFRADIAKYGKPALVLRGARKRLEITQAQLAKKLGITQANLSAMENGKRTIGVKMAKRLGYALRIGYRVFL